ncbi:DUF1566 domain-containing protein [Moraxella equi]|uniref:Protein of uncharacterized function (DUF1566) n=1 Tax=Moraxella equi TaxID=60442 RepID=A0A378QRU4_9GAMM|nr:DUF1566 domain-containing protein [Moraxella equi]OPH38006.1 hypothetical protein B5J93_07225 [Moraxella equi]STZ03508.1 Protein of uncharacterised function (DUF1566) [Moraxella equi]
MLKLFLTKSLLVALPMITLASTANAVSDTELMKKGIWRDPKTGLYWDRCSVGQTWNGTTCTGTPIELNWQDAKDYVKKFTNEQAKGGYTNWRLPTIQELSTIRYCSKGWFQNIETKKVSELTAQGRVEREVTTNHGTIMMTIPADNGGSLQVPEWCADGSIAPTLNAQIFPNSKDDPYWSSSPYANNSNNAWGAGFYYGSASYYNKDYSTYVRAVRSD